MLNKDDEIILREKEYWNERKLERSRIKKIRRHAFYYSYKKERRIVEELTKSFKDKKVLEIGSHSWVAWIKNDSFPKELTCINISEEELRKGEEMAKSAQLKIDFHLMDANNLTFESNKFDVVYGGAILHHLNIEKALEQIHRVLKPNGELLFLEPLNMNPLYWLYRKLTPKERTPDEHALVRKDLKLIKSKFRTDHVYMDFFSVAFGLISLKIYGDKNYDNWINKLGYNLDNLIAKIPLFKILFARVIIHGYKK